MACRLVELISQINKCWHTNLVLSINWVCFHQIWNVIVNVNINDANITAIIFNENHVASGSSIRDECHWKGWRNKKHKRIRSIRNEDVEVADMVHVLMDNRKSIREISYDAASLYQNSIHTRLVQELNEEVSDLSV